MAHFDEKEFEAEDDLRTIRRAKEISGDPKRLKAANKIADKEIKALNEIKGSTLLTGKKKDTLLTK